jgi:4-hydroxy-tetrahydrodipicolinate synthase
MMFGRVLTAMITPFDAAGQVNYAKAAELAAHLAANGTDTLVICGTTLPGDQIGGSRES